jgi:S-adenosylmethionine synthetase
MTKRDNYILTAESVTEGHPDKLCDTIADAVLDACLLGDPDSRVACEVLATAGKITVAGEITTKAMPDIPHIVCKTVRQIGYSGNYEVEVDIHDQSPDIANAVNGENEITSGDQGIVYGYACRETPLLLPLPVVLAHRITMALTEARQNHLLEWLRPDGKAQVSVEYEDGKPMRVATVVVSTQHEPEISQKELQEAVYQLILVPALGKYLDQNTEILINPSGSFVLGGFEADTGLTGRKLMVDTYGGIVPHGGGALSGKDCTKVDRSGAYMARYLAKNIVAAGLADKCTVSMAYAIGKAEPLYVQADTHGTGRYPDSVLEEAVKLLFDLTPTGMANTLQLMEPIYQKHCNYGHFTHQSAPWEQTDCAELLWEGCDMAAERM